MSEKRIVHFKFSTTDKLLSRIIRFFQRRPFSHSYFQFYNDYVEMDLIYESRGLGSHLVNAKHMDGREIASFQREVSEEDFQKIMKYTYEDIGTPYGWKTLIGFLYVAICRSIGLKVRNPFPDKKSRVCAEAQGKLLILFFKVEEDIDEDDIDLVWLYDKMKTDPNFTIEELKKKEI